MHICQDNLLCLLWCKESDEQYIRLIKINVSGVLLHTIGKMSTNGQPEDHWMYLRLYYSLPYHLGCRFQIRMSVVWTMAAVLRSVPTGREPLSAVVCLDSRSAVMDSAVVVRGHFLLGCMSTQVYRAIPSLIRICEVRTYIALLTLLTSIRKATCDGKNFKSWGTLVMIT